MGPSAIRYADLQQALEALGHPVTDLGNIPVPVRESCPPGDSTLKYMEPIVQVQATLADRVAGSMAQGHFPLVLGGDHSLSAGSVTGALRHRRLGLIWLDAHGDFNTHETSLSGNIHGMPLAALCGRGAEPLVTLAGREARPKLQPRNVSVVGVRDLDADERTLMRAAGVNVWSMEAVDRLGIHEVMRQAIEAAADGTDGLWLSLDLDVIDPTFAPGVGTPVALPPLDGVVMANVLHFVADAGGVLRRVAGVLKPGGRLVLIEYQGRRPSPWVPYPVDAARFVELAAAHGFTPPRTAAVRPSLFGGQIYAAVTARAA